MESGLILIFAIGIVSLLLIYLAFALDKEHFFLKLLILMFLFPFLTLLGKAAIDYENPCEVVVATANESQTGYFEYSYQQQCFASDTNTATTFFKSLTWLMRFFYVYVFLYFNYDFWLKTVLVKLFHKFKRKKS